MTFFSRALFFKNGNMYFEISFEKLIDVVNVIQAFFFLIFVVGIAL